MARTWELARGAVLIPSGLPLPIAGTDQFHEFHVHAEHYYLAGASEPGQVLTFDPGEGWTLFAHLASQEEKVWTGDAPPLERTATRTGLSRVRTSTDLEGWLEQRRGEPLALIGNRDLLARPWEYGIATWAAQEVDVDERLSARLSERVSEARRTKDAVEVDAMQKAAAASGRGHAAGMRLARPGLTERDLQVEIESEFFRGGAPRTAYGSIVGSGANAAVLHGTPGARELREGDLVLVDAGAEYHGYASDVTRTYPAGNSFTGLQADLYDLVYSVQQGAISRARPGTEYRDLHLEACVELADGLVALGILRGTAQDLVEQDAHALFLPHGLGHMLGLATHDAGGCLAGREPSQRFGLSYLRADLPLEAGYVVTIEPGLYFIRALLTDPERRARYREAVDWARVDTLLDAGGIRTEDDVLITDDGAEVLTAHIPSRRSEIEEIRRQAAAR